MCAFTILSLTHSDDFDGIGSQAIIHRYFSVLKKPIPTEFHDKPNELVSLKLFQSDYQDYMFYWAAIITGFKQKTSNIPLNFEKIWKKTYLELHQVQSDKELVENFSMVSKAAKKRILDNSSLWKSVDLVIITDIGINEVYREMLLDLIKKNDIPFAYFDHHKHSQDAQEFYKKHSKKYVINSSKFTCATRIVHDFFLPNDEISQNIAKLGFNTDHEKCTMPDSKEIMTVISYYRKDGNKLNEIVEKYSNAVNFDEQLKKIYIPIKIWEDAEFDKIKSTLLLTKHRFSDGTLIHFLIGVSELRAGRLMDRLEDARYQSQLEILNPLSSDDKLVLLAIDRNELNSNIHSKSLDVQKVAEHFGGGGHWDRAGFRFPPKLISKEKRKNFIPHDIDLKEFFKEFAQADIVYC
jgi:oligoribonuclease NrnB/cAMP/cGMP phosphodiesterase (DHH superfamily)